MPLVRRTPLRRSAIKKRPRNRQQAITNSTLRPRSKKTAAMYRSQRVPLVRRILADRPICEARVPLVCNIRSVDAHEILARSQGGSILDEENILAVCSGCHRWITDHPAEAKELGLRRSRYD